MQLSSIPEVNTAQNVPKPEESGNENAKDEKETTQNRTEPNNEQTTVKNEPVTESILIKPEYERFIKMVQVGVPLDAVKLKISLEGLDPKEFDNIMKK